MASGGQTYDGRQLSDLEVLQLKANQITDESLESTRRMVVLCEEVVYLRLQINF
jgi:synaptosomal-associated protein 25